MKAYYFSTGMRFFILCFKFIFSILKSTEGLLLTSVFFYRQLDLKLKGLFKKI